MTSIYNVVFLDFIIYFLMYIFLKFHTIAQYIKCSKLSERIACIDEIGGGEVHRERVSAPYWLAGYTKRGTH